LLLFVAVCSLWLPAQVALAAPAVITISELNAQSKALDGQVVCFQGEVIGDAIKSTEGCVWLALRDAHSAISVIIDADKTADIGSFGRYQVEGTTVEITGTFHLACDEHDGLTDVHALSLRVISPGGSVPEPLDTRLLVAGVVMALVGAALTFFYRLLVERSR
jgi:hypothetical protein